MIRIPQTCLVTPVMKLHVPTIATIEEYYEKKGEFSIDKVNELITDEFTKTRLSCLLDILENGFTLLSDCEPPTNDFFFWSYGAYGIIPIYIGEVKGHKIGYSVTTADLIIPNSQLSVLYDTSKNKKPVPPKAITTYLVYAKSSNKVKIGKTTNFQQRIKTLTTSVGEELEVLGLINEDKESELHKTFKEHRIKGEWFHYSEEIRLYVDSLNPLKVA